MYILTSSISYPIYAEPDDNTIESESEETDIEDDTESEDETDNTENSKDDSTLWPEGPKIKGKWMLTLEQSFMKRKKINRCIQQVSQRY